MRASVVRFGCQPAGALPARRAAEGPTEGLNGYPAVTKTRTMDAPRFNRFAVNAGRCAWNLMTYADLLAADNKTKGTP